MMTEPYKRYALYYVPPPGALALFGAKWLGWDLEHGETATMGDLHGLPLSLSDITESPRRYGLHGTVVAPFYLRDSMTPKAMQEVLRLHCARIKPVVLSGLELTQLGRFLALTPLREASDLQDLAANMVRLCDDHRAPLLPADIVRHRSKGLTPDMDALLMRWGYPYVMQAYRFHMTLTSKLPKAHARAVKDALNPVLRPILPRPFVIDQLAFVGEDQDGLFHLIERFSLRGASVTL